MAAWPGVGQAALSFMELVFVVIGPVAAFQEVNGENIRYSKFASEGKKKNVAMIESKKGMFLFYFPAALLASVFLACRLGVLPLATFLKSLGASGAAAFWENAFIADDAGDHRLLLVAAALSLHFSKRVLEVLFVHKYSGSICVSDNAQISLSYAIQVCLLLYSQLLSATASPSAAKAALPGALPFPNQNLKWLGVALFLIGVTGNAYHHWLLSHLRKDGNKKYVVPQGGLFGYLVCPHYVFEIVDMAGIALISQTLFSVCMVWFVSWYLTGRAIASKKWYLKKVEGFPEERSVLIPGIF